MKISKEFYNEYYNNGTWSKSDQIAYNVILKEESKIAKDRSDSIKQANTDTRTVKELNSDLIKLTTLYREKNMYTWESDIKKDTRYKEILKLLKEKKKK